MFSIVFCAKVTLIFFYNLYTPKHPEPQERQLISGKSKEKRDE